MKRSEITRKVGLKSRRPNQKNGRTITCAAPGCSNERYFRASKIIGKNYCCRACFWADTAAREADRAKARSGSASYAKERKGKANPAFKHGRDTGRRERAGERRFHSGQDRCQHPSCPGLHAVTNQHHVVYSQHVVREHGDRWDALNALTLCVSCHMSHHRRGQVLPLSALRDENYVFARGLLGEAAHGYLRRRYSGNDPRLTHMATATNAEHLAEHLGVDLESPAGESE